MSARTHERRARGEERASKFADKIGGWAGPAAKGVADKQRERARTARTRADHARANDELLRAAKSLGVKVGKSAKTPPAVKGSERNGPRGAASGRQSGGQPTRRSAYTRRLTSRVSSVATRAQESAADLTYLAVVGVLGLMAVELLVTHGGQAASIEQWIGEKFVGFAYPKAIFGGAAAAPATQPKQFGPPLPSGGALLPGLTSGSAVPASNVTVRPATSAPGRSVGAV